jgi:GGDEF domain-containing protein
VELQTAIDEVVFEARPGKRLHLGISIGAAVFPHDGNTYETLLATADSRMYRDKTKRKQVLITKLGADYVPSRRQSMVPAISEIDLERAASGVL